MTVLKCPLCQRQLIDITYDNICEEYICTARTKIFPHCTIPVDNQLPWEVYLLINEGIFNLSIYGSESYLKQTNGKCRISNEIIKIPSINKSNILTINNLEQKLKTILIFQ